MVFVVRRFTVLCVLVVGLGCGPSQALIGVERAAATVEYAEAPVAVFLTITNAGPFDRLVAVDAAAAGYVWVATQQPHRMPGMTPGGANALPPLLMPSGPLSVTARANTRLLPGGNTIVLYELRQPVRVGDNLPMRLKFQSGATADVRVPVLDYADIEAVIDPQAVARIPRGEVPSVAQGRELYRANGCAACHGLEGRGDGPVAGTLSPRPRDLSNPLSYRVGIEVDAIARTLAAGLPAAGSMPLYSHLSNHERRSMALFIRSLHSSSR